MHLQAEEPQALSRPAILLALIQSPAASFPQLRLVLHPNPPERHLGRCRLITAWWLLRIQRRLSKAKLRPLGTSLRPAHFHPLLVIQAVRLEEPDQPLLIRNTKKPHLEKNHTPRLL